VRDRKEKIHDSFSGGFETIYWGWTILKLPLLGGTRDD